MSKKQEETKAKLLSKFEKVSAENLRDTLPKDTFVSIPDDVLVEIQTSRLTAVSLHNCLDYVLSDKSEQEIFETLMKVKADFKDDQGNNLDSSEITPLDNAVWILTTLIHEIGFQAANQNKTEIYDREEVYKALSEEINESIKPLSDEELKSRTDKPDDNGEVIIEPNED